MRGGLKFQKTTTVKTQTCAKILNDINFSLRCDSDRGWDRESIAAHV